MYKQVILKKANPIISIYPKDTTYFFFKYASKKQLKHFPYYWLNAVKKADVHIAVETEFNTRELSSCDPKKIALRTKIMDRIEKHVLKKRNICVTYPCPAYAIEAEMSFDEWKDFTFSSCLIDWDKFHKRYIKVKKYFEKGKKIHLIGENVDLKFSINNKYVLFEDGKDNMPGGEIYMAPIKTSLNGYIKFEYPSLYDGREIKGIYLEFKNGKIVKYSASKNQKMLKGVIEADKNSSYIGEFGIGLNPNIKNFSNNLLFDEKISGTIHLAIGLAYLENGGGNDSVIHWDIVKDMKKAKIILDGKVVQENGKWKI